MHAIPARLGHEASSSAQWARQVPLQWYCHSTVLLTVLTTLLPLTHPPTQEMINYDKVKTLIDRFDPEAHTAAAKAAMMLQQGEQATALICPKTLAWDHISSSRCRMAAMALSLVAH